MVATPQGSLPSAGRRIARADGARGTDHARAHRTARRASATGPVDPVSGRLGQPTRANGGKRLRS